MSAGFAEELDESHVFPLDGVDERRSTESVAHVQGSAALQQVGGHLVTTFDLE